MSDWWNVDLRAFPGIDAVMDVTKPWPFDGWEYVYGEHFLEHWSLEGAIAFINHAWKSLKYHAINFELLKISLIL
jgi:predicted SAM-dependent methyltransferase